MSVGQEPDFVCIGTQKSGTTWLYENLAKHPDVWLPPVKEFHYFNRVCINDQLLGDWDIPHPHGIKRYSSALKKLDIKLLRWLVRYYELGMTKDWYLSLFDKSYTAGKVCGDITPGYSTLDERGVKYASEVLNKNIPIILIVRNPIYRSWSAAKMLMRSRSLSVDSVEPEAIIELLEAPVVKLSSEYSRMIPLWKKYFNNFYLLSFDELGESPQLLLTKISRILNISDDWDESTIKKRVWADKKKLQMPASVLTVLIDKYASEIDTLRKMDDCAFAQSWYEEISQLRDSIA